jgi:hypothetical protein
MWGYRLAAFAAGVTLAGASASAEPGPKWGAHLDFEGKLGTDRHLGEVDAFLPVAQDGDTLVFASLRTRMDDDQSREGNFGGGVRQMLESGWNIGGYGYYDRRRSDNEKYFNQATLGAEALGRDWDLRANAYLPLGTMTHYVDSQSTAEIAGTSVIFRGGQEHAMRGFDAEIGYRLPVFADDEGIALRIYGGAYRFTEATGTGVPDVTGPRGRLDLTWDRVPELWEGSRFSLGLEVQKDDPRGEQAFLSARLRVPLQPERADTSRLSPQERRMTDPIVRDIDIVTQAGNYGGAEIATASNGGTLTFLSSADTAALATAITNAGTNSTVILSGSFDTGNDTTIVLNSGQTVMGTGSITVRSRSGRTATLTRSSGATITSTNATVASNMAAIDMAANSTLTGLTLTPTTGVNGASIYAVRVNGVGGATIANNIITATSGHSSATGVRVTGSSAANVTISGNTITATNTAGGTAIGVTVDVGTATIADNSFSVTTAGTKYSVYANGTGSTTKAIFGTGSTGNTFSTAAGCTLSGSTFYSGTLYYTNSTGTSGSCGD